ncbi:MAG: TPM domain-containing protein, partial [Candidatus Eremiobacteraeota bacterium]|nr:TPM domain-containing protein [Candidatus Eremiobacteraeota bacterium]
PVKAAEEQLRHARLHRHPHRNSVVFAVAPHARQFAVYGDEAIHRKLGPEYWTRLVEEMTQRFKAGEPTDALIYGVKRIGEQLRAHFPKAGTA